MTNRYYNPDRMYEITAIDPKHIWAPTFKNSSTVVGAIVQPAPRDEWDIRRHLSWRVIRSVPGTLYPTPGNQISMFGEGLTLRPLSQKEQRKLEMQTKLPECV